MIDYTAMFVVLVLSMTLGATMAGYAGSDSNSVGNGNGYGYGYSGSFSSGNGGNIPNIPIPPIPNFDFGFLNGLQAQAQQFAAQGAAGAPAGGVNSGFGGSFSGTDGGASASGSIGPQGGYQSASVYPENPSNPNIFTRFGGETPQGGGGGGGSYGVFSSSVSSSSNLDGKPQNFHQASTTINDNGKVTTYTVKNP